MTLFQSTMFMLFISSSSAIQFYQPVDGNCSDLPRLEKFNNLKVDSGEWFYQYASFGEEGDCCVTGHGTARGTSVYVDLLLFNPEKNKYVTFSDDLTYHPDQPGLYTNIEGATGRMVGCDNLRYFYYVQCLEKDGRNNVMAMIATRDREANKEIQQIYEDISSKLADVKLLPKMHKINQTDCPLTDSVDIEKPT